MSDWLDDGYPTELALKRIREWPINDCAGALDFICELWHWPRWGVERNGDTLTLHTGGWSGNENLIGALMDNQMVWALCWRKAERGGHYTLEVKR